MDFDEKMSQRHCQEVVNRKHITKMLHNSFLLPQIAVFRPFSRERAAFFKFFELFCKKKVILSSGCWRYPILRVVKAHF